MAFPNPFKAIAGVVLAIPRAISRYAEEQRRLRELEAQRIATPPDYSDGISELEFQGIVDKAGKSIPRIKDTSIDGFVVRILVKSQSGISIWSATVDFNDFGKLTGWYKIRSENSDSNIPEAFAREVNDGVNELKKRKVGNA